MTRPLPNSVRMIRIRIAIEDMTLCDRLFCGYPAGSGAGSSVETFKLLLLILFMTNQFVDIQQVDVLCSVSSAL